MASLSPVEAANQAPKTVSDLLQAPSTREHDETNLLLQLFMDQILMTKSRALESNRRETNTHQSLSVQLASQYK